MTSEVATKGSAPTSYHTYDPATNRLLDSSYTFDANGNLTAMPGFGLTYNVENRMTQAVSNLNGTENYGYDPAGLRVWKQGPDGVIHVYYNGSGGRPLADFYYDSGYGGARGGTPMVYFAGKRVDNVSVEDRLGTAVVEGGQSMKYFPYGEVRSGTSAVVQFATYSRDSTTNLDYAHHRYYSSQIARYTTPDPKASSAKLQIPQSWNRYTYALGDPINLTDSTGADPIDEDGDPFGATAGFGAVQWSGLGLPGDVAPGDDDGGAGGSGGAGGYGSPPQIPYSCDLFGGCWTPPFGFDPGRFPQQPPDWLVEWRNLSQTCQDALRTALPGKLTNTNIQAWVQALNRAWAQEGALTIATAGTGIDWTMVAAIGIRESGFQDVLQSGGLGVGVFQIDLGQNPTVTAGQALNVSWAANWTASKLASDYAELAADLPNLNPPQLLQATAASYNFGTGNISGNPATIDLGTTRNNYGSNTMNLMDCFR